MALEDLVGPDKFIDAFNRDWPEGSDVKSEGDDHLRGIKNVSLNSFPAITGAVSLTQDQINALPDDILAAILIAQQAFIGSMAMFATAVGDYPGWQLADGQLLDPADFPTLFARLGTNFGGDGVTTFGVPDARGRFPRAKDFGKGINPDGDLDFGVEQADQNLDHTHSYTAPTIGGGQAVVAAVQNTATLQTGAEGGNEARPRAVTFGLYIYSGEVGA